MDILIPATYRRSIYYWNAYCMFKCKIYHNANSLNHLQDALDERSYKYTFVASGYRIGNTQR